MRIALLEDDVDQANLVSAWLTDAGHHVRHFEASRDFLRAVLRDSYELLVLDWMLPRMDGLEVMQRVRESLRNYTPILFVTARDEEDAVVKALEAGADDYMAKPLARREFLARVTALGRRSGGFAGEQITDVEPYEIDVERKAIALKGEAIELTHREFDLAAFMFRHVGSVISRAHILESIWGMHGADLNTRTVDTHISRLRKKLILTEENGWVLSAIYQHGYRLERLAEQDADGP
ncbi:MAG: response regulator transcription factor [Pseudomonadota bacterium]